MRGGGGTTNEGGAGVSVETPDTNRDGPPTTRGTTPIAGACSTDNDCASGLSCVTVLGNSATAIHYVVGGYCSTACVDDADCSSFGDGSYCYRGLFGSEQGFCLASCTPGAPEVEKCQGRTDLLCFGLPGEAGSCAPGCNQNSDCGLDDCDLGNGQCRRVVVDDGTESPIGSACPPDQPVTCDGFCTGDPTETGVCTGRCRLGSSCGAGDVCASSTPELRPGDFGLCELVCDTSADCVPGVTACAPTGFIAPSGNPERSCVAAPASESLANQRLSVEGMLAAPLHPELVAVRSYGVGQTLQRLTASEAGVCISGTHDDFGSAAVIVFQLGTGEGVPFDATGADSIVLEWSGTSPLLLLGQLTSRPGAIYSNPLSLSPGRVLVPFAQLRADEPGDPPWDPAQIEAVRLAVIGAAGLPFELCVTALGFE